MLINIEFGAYLQQTQSFEVLSELTGHRDSNQKNRRENAKPSSNLLLLFLLLFCFVFFWPTHWKAQHRYYKTGDSRAETQPWVFALFHFFVVVVVQLSTEEIFSVPDMRGWAKCWQRQSAHSIYCPKMLSQALCYWLSWQLTLRQAPWLMSKEAEPELVYVICPLSYSLKCGFQEHQPEFYGHSSPCRGSAGRRRDSKLWNTWVMQQKQRRGCLLFQCGF